MTEREEMKPHLRAMDHIQTKKLGNCVIIYRCCVFTIFIICVFVWCDVVSSVYVRVRVRMRLEIKRI